ncbi:DNA primase [Flavobacteriaceae bacterium]|nr:DNA primase [Flavobacteriaceae bacterium]MDA8757982.1 DNA primase [Flavobacteriaceae bacterium]MDA8763357.1 DNA primase [Flavobacteriaceae bacterium]MDB2314135.1 DNA primase [Flavobacteriaceae bacterium]MDC3238481.1 DNA primase [Flavobacteriaceae bacterium]
MISRSTIDQVYETARLEEVIGEYVTLKKSGANYKGLSPFSQERTPSFMVSPVKQIWKDFSSGKGGNVIAFLMEHEHFTYPEAIRYLAKKYNIEIEETEETPEEKQIKDTKESMFLVAQYAAGFFEKNLWETELGKSIGLTYFKERGFKDETIKKFALGYSPESYDALSKQAQKEGYKLDFLEKTGLVIVNEDRQIDRFRGRVLFPIRSMSGRVQGFGGRILSQNAKTAKYLNSPESEIYNKSKVLYGIYESKQSIAQNDVCYLVEGYTDVIQMHQSGITNVVSSSGTALTVDQIRMINRLTSNIVVLFDGDAAGLRASLRGIDLILEQGMNVRVCTFPEGDDPDSFAQSRSTEEINDFLGEASKDFIQFKASLLSDEGKNDPIRKAETIREIVESIHKIPDPIKQEIYIQNCAEIMEISEDALFSALAQINQKNKQKGAKRFVPDESVALVKKTTDASAKVDRIFELERQIISILLTYGNQKLDFEEPISTTNDEGELIEETQQISAKVYEKIFLDLQQDEIELSHETFKKIFYKLIEFYQSEQGDLNIEKIMQTDDLSQNEMITDLVMKEEQHQLHDWEKRNVFVKVKGSEVVRLVSETILSMRRYLIDQKITELQLETKEQDNNQEILREIQMYQGLKNIISNRLHRVV